MRGEGERNMSRRGRKYRSEGEERGKKGEKTYLKGNGGKKGEERIEGKKRRGEREKENKSKKANSL